MKSSFGRRTNEPRGRQVAFPRHHHDPSVLLNSRNWFLIALTASSRSGPRGLLRHSASLALSSSFVGGGGGSGAFEFIV